MSQTVLISTQSQLGQQTSGLMKRASFLYCAVSLSQTDDQGQDEKYKGQDLQLIDRKAQPWLIAF